MADSSKENVQNDNGKESKAKTERWTWSDEKTEMFFLKMKAFKVQKLGEGIEWNSDKVAMVEHVRRKLAEKWPADFGKDEITRPLLSLDDMTKEEYQRYTETRKIERQSIANGYRRVFNKLKTMKRKFAIDCKNNLRSGAGQVTAKFWQLYKRMMTAVV